MHEVMVTGLGIVTAIGSGPEAFSHALRLGQTRFRARQPEELRAGFVGVAAPIDGFELQREVGALSRVPDRLKRRAVDIARRAPFSVQVGVVAALQAWESALLSEVPAEPSRVALVVAGHNLNEMCAYRAHVACDRSPEAVPPRYGLDHMDSQQVGVLSELFQVRGEGFTVGGASASGNLGIIMGCRLVRWGVADVCIVLGALTDVSPAETRAWLHLGALLGDAQRAPEAACRPFDRERQGFVPGQGAGCLVLESIRSVRGRSVTPLVELAGIGMALDGNRSSNPNRGGEAIAMRKALDDAGVSPVAVDYINAHGTASVLGDETELEAIGDVFGEAINRVWINSTKGLTGHCLCAAGVVEAVATILQMKGGFVHPNPNLDSPISDRFRFAPLESREARLDVAQSNSFGFGGINSSVVFRSWRDAAEGRRGSDDRADEGAQQ